MCFRTTWSDKNLDENNNILFKITTELILTAHQILIQKPVLNVYQKFRIKFFVLIFINTEIRKENNIELKIDI
jgi:hypothetical protein